MNITRRRKKEKRIKRANKHGSLKQKEAISEKLHKRKSCSEDQKVLRIGVSLSGKEVCDYRRCPNAGDHKGKPVSSLPQGGINASILDFLPSAIAVAKALRSRRRKEAGVTLSGGIGVRFCRVPR